MTKIFKFWDFFSNVILSSSRWGIIGLQIRADSRLAPSQWKTSLQSNAVSHWLGANLESALHIITWCPAGTTPFQKPMMVPFWRKFCHWLHFSVQPAMTISSKCGDFHLILCLAGARRVEPKRLCIIHYSDVIMAAIWSQITNGPVRLA